MRSPSETGWDPASAEVDRRHLGRLDARPRCSPAGCRPGSWSPTRPARPSRASSTPPGVPAAEADRTGGAAFELDLGWPPPIGPGSWPLALRTLLRPAQLHPRQRASPAGCRAGSSRPSRCASRSAGSSRRAGRRTPDCGSSPATTRPASGSPSARPTRRGRARRRRRGLVRDPGLLPAGRDRRAPLRRRRHVLDLEPRARPRPRPRPRHLPQPDLVAAPGAGDRPARVEQRLPAARLRTPARARGPQAARRRHRGRPRAAARAGPEDDEPQPDELREPQSR